MKYLILILMLISTGSYAKEINVKVNGLVCSLCALGIPKLFKPMKEVKDVRFDADNKLAIISTNDGQDVSDETINKTITDAGYNVVSIERK